MDHAEIVEWVAGALEGVAVVVASEENGAPEVAWGDVFFFYDPDGDEAARRMPFATIVTKDYEGFDTKSDLNRAGVFRVNIWISKETFHGLLGMPARAGPTSPLSIWRCRIPCTELRAGCRSSIPDRRPYRL